MADNDTYITLAELKNTAELASVNFADYDAAAAINAASRGIDEYCGRFFYQTMSGTQTRYYTTQRSVGYYPWAGQAYLDVDDIVTAGTVRTDWDGDGVLDTTWVANTDYVLEPFNAADVGKPYETVRVHPNSSLRFPVWPRSVAVTGQFGWPAVPAAVKQATTVMAMRLLRRAREAPFGVVGIGLDNAAVRMSRVDPDMAFLLDPLVRGRVLAA